ncbi:MAG: 2-C-methyl-D-erythritol 4-phosphate cytidylyltransferase [Mycobacterium sp.]|jgi:2-C-methyl-D-erythritol 4-phosphate cytidylyltransferase|uniref:IspD/TarI family cytidylyltransferase n=1 Tax=Mycobacterium sp. TaxID=1785 RepID=UPI0028BA97FA|nr:2-C-methyl-D-erythritol 4-phosphate cytidylyltransferase [Mycobacterium sp.]
MAADLAAIVPLPAPFADNAAFAPLAGEPPLARVAGTMLGAAVVAVAEPHIDAVRESLAAHGLSDVGVAVAEDPGSRAQCLAAGLQYLKDAPRHVLIHDLRRPLAPASLRDRVISALQAGSPVVMPVLAVTDSVKAVDARGFLTGTLDRSTLRTVQYPRGFAADQLSQLLAGRTSDEFDELDESLRTGTRITFVDGDSDAFVIELPRDAAFVEAIIACRQTDPHPADG